MSSPSYGFAVDSPTAPPRHAAVAATAEDGALGVAALAPEIIDPTSLRQRQLAEFNQWLFRWNDYQHHLTSYWKERYHDLYSRHESAGGGDEVNTEGGKVTGGKVTGKIEEKWKFRYQELLDFKEEHGHTNVPRGFTFKHSPPLGTWVGRMRILHAKKRLEQSRVERLAQIGFQFVVTNHDMVPFSAMWDKSYRALAAFKEAHGHIEVPSGRTGLDGWISRQRGHFRKGKLPEHLKAKLQALGIDLGGSGRPYGVQSEEAWSAKRQALDDYRATHGDCDVPAKYSEDRELGTWVQAQRDAHDNGTLSDCRVRSLAQLGFDFGRKTPTATPTDPWQRRLSELRGYKKREGHTDVPRNFDINLELGEFVFNQRMAHKNNTLSEDKRKALEEMGFEFAFKTKRVRQKKTMWESKFDELVEFKSKHGDLQVPGKPEENKLVKWMRRQRQYHREGRIKSDKYERLKALGFCFGEPKPEGKPWMRHYESLIDFHKESGHFRVPIHYKPDPQLYTWVQKQKHLQKAGKLAEDRLALLHEIEFDFTPRTKGARESRCSGSVRDVDVHPPRGAGFSMPEKKKSTVNERQQPQPEPVDRDSSPEDLWETSYRELVAYKTRFGHCHIPITYEANLSLGAWAFSQQMAYKRNKLSKDRTKKLNELGFLFGPREDSEAEETEV